MPATNVLALKMCKECGSDDISPANLKKKYYICRGCLKTRQKIRYINNRKVYLSQAKGQYLNADITHGTRAWCKRYLAQKRYRDKKYLKTTICDITVDQLLALIKKPCFYCKDTKDRISIDRVDNTMGHTIGNVVPCCYTCNSARMDSFSHKEMVIIGKAIKEIKTIRRSK